MFFRCGGGLFANAGQQSNCRPSHEFMRPKFFANETQTMKAEELDDYPVELKFEPILVEEDSIDRFLHSSGRLQNKGQLEATQDSTKKNRTEVEVWSKAKNPRRYIRVAKQLVPIARGFEYFPFGKRLKFPEATMIEGRRAIDKAQSESVWSRQFWRLPVVSVV